MKKLLPLFLLLQFVAIRSFSQDLTGPVSKATAVAVAKASNSGTNSESVKSSYSTKSISRFSQQASTSAKPVNQSNLILGNVSSVKSGLWSQTSTWSSGALPTAADNVTIADGNTVTVDMAANAYSLIVGQGSSGKLFYNNGVANKLTVSKNITIKPGAVISTPGTGAAINTNELSLGGSLLNQGTLDLIPTGGTQSGALTFTGEGNVNYTGTGINNLALLNAAKANPADIIEINVNKFTTGGLSTGATKEF